MKRVLIVVLLIALALALCGCGQEVVNYKGETVTINDGWDEWISPDGVHYWIYTVGQRYGLAPRYDHNGDLVIDE